MTRPDGPTVFLTHTGAESGAELAMARMAIGLHDAGSDVAVFSTQDGPVLTRLRTAGVRAELVPTDFDSSRVVIGGSVLRLLDGVRSMVRTGRTIGDMARSHGAVALVAESSKALLMGAFAARRAGIPLIWHVHDRVTSEFFGSALALVIRVLGAVTARAFIANSEATASTLWHLGKPLVVAYPGIDVPHAANRPHRPADAVRLCMVGRLTSWKGQDILLDALALSAHEPHVWFVGGTHFGEEAYAAELDEKAKALGLSDRITFTGHVDDPLSILAESDVAVHCSRVTEPFGQVIVEAMASGCAVIAADAGGPREIVTDQITGLLVDCTSDGAARRLALAIDRLIGDADLRREVARAGQRRSADFSIERTCQQVSTVLPLRPRRTGTRRQNVDGRA